MALEIGLYSLQIANSSIYMNKGALSTEARHDLQPKWVYATFIAGMCSEIYRPITNMVVVDDEGEHWPQLLTPLYDWIVSRKKERYFIVWNIQDEVGVICMHQASTAYLMNAIVPMPCLQYMNDGNSEIVAAMTSCITGAIPQGAINQIRQIIVSVQNKVIERDIKSNGERYGVCTVGTHLEPHLIDAMRRLIRKKTWEVNVKSARVWYSDEGLFVVWQTAARELIGLLSEDSQAGIPQDGDTLADIMIAGGIAESNEDNGRYWDICIPVSMQILPAIKICKPEILFSDPSLFQPIPTCLIRSPNQQQESPIETLHEVYPTDAQISSIKTVSSIYSDKIKKEDNPPSIVTLKTQVLLPLTSVQDNQGKRHEPVSEMDQAVKVLKQTETPQITKLEIHIDSVPTKPASIVKSKKTGGEQGDDLGVHAEKLFTSLPNEISDFIRAIIDDYQDGSTKGEVFSVDAGMAISTEELESHGQTSYAALIKTLHDRNWLWIDPTKPMRKLFEVVHKSKKCRVIIIRPEISRGMGFDWRKPKSS